MFARVFAYIRQQLFGFLAFVMVLMGGTAYAANEWTGANIVDESLTSSDIQNQQVKVNDLALGSVWGSRIKDDGITSNHVVNNSLKGHDIDEQTFTAPLVRAFVRVNPATCTGPAGDQTCGIERSKGVTRVTRIDQGAYCVRAPAISSQNVSAAATVDDDGASFYDTSVHLDTASDPSGSLPCPAASDFLVRTFLASTALANRDTGVNNQQVLTPYGDYSGVPFQLVIP